MSVSVASRSAGACSNGVRVSNPLARGGLARTSLNGIGRTSCAAALPAGAGTLPRSNSSGRLPDPDLDDPLGGEPGLEASPCASRQVAEVMELMHASGNDQIKRYLDLLADSTNSPGAMQKHMLKLAACGMATANKLHQCVTDPLAGLSDSVADRTVDHIMHTMDELTSVKAEQRWQCARKKVMGVVAVQRNLQAIRANDDAVRPLPPTLSSGQAKLMHVLMSTVVSGVISSGAAHALPAAADIAAHVSMPLPETVSARPAPAAPKSISFSAMRTAPDLVGGADCAGDAAAAGGGMAAATVRRLVRADSKVVACAEEAASLLGAVVQQASQDAALAEQVVEHSLDVGLRSRALQAAGEAAKNVWAAQLARRPRTSGRRGW